MGESERKRAFISNGSTSALELDGTIDWFTSPRFDSQAIFCSLLDRKKGGSFSVYARGSRISSSYIGNSLALRTIFTTKGGRLELTDFLPIGVPGIIRIFKSSIPFRAEINPVFYYGRISPRIGRKRNGLSFRNPHSKESIEVRIDGNYKIGKDGVIEISPGSGSIMAIHSNGEDRIIPDPRKELQKALSHWDKEISKAKRPKVFKDEYYRSIATVLGLVYEPSGAIVAAPTTSLPEIIGYFRNWDYRYLWIRDASYAAEALSNIGLTSTSKRILDFMLKLLEYRKKSFPHPLAGVDGKPPEKERTLDWLGGYENSSPVRVGNAAYDQIQMDVEGEFIDAFYTYVRNSGDYRYVRENWRALEAIAKWSSKSWKKKSISLWEEREAPRHYVHTKAMQWTAMDRCAKLASMAGRKDYAKRWDAVADEIKSDVMKNGVSRASGSFVKSYGSEDVDASLLTLPLYGFIDGRDPIFKATLKRIVKELLLKDSLLLRYKSDAMGRAANPFTLLSTWLARVYIKSGEKGKAKKVISDLISISTDLGLFAEHVDPKTREPRGNFPQLFPHAGLIQAISELDS